LKVFTDGGLFVDLRIEEFVEGLKDEFEDLVDKLTVFEGAANAQLSLSSLTSPHPWLSFLKDCYFLKK